MSNGLSPYVCLIILTCGIYGRGVFWLCDVAFEIFKVLASRMVKKDSCTPQTFSRTCVKGDPSQSPVFPAKMAWWYLCIGPPWSSLPAPPFLPSRYSGFLWVRASALFSVYALFLVNVIPFPMLSIQNVYFMPKSPFWTSDLYIRDFFYVSTSTTHWLLSTFKSETGKVTGVVRCW